MNTGLPPLAGLLTDRPALKQTDTEKQKEVRAAKDFEALLISQVLRSARGESAGWLGTGDDDASGTAFSLGEEELAKAMTAGGGLGLSKVIASGLAARREAVEAEPGGDHSNQF